METFGAIAQRLSDNGYLPLPVVAGQKNPVHKDWPNYRFKAGDEGRWKGCSTGILTGHIATPDIDVRDPKLAKLIEAKAIKLFGAAPRRIGSAPKVLLVYRAVAPFSKIQTRGYRLPGDAPDAKAHKVEILGTGQQFVAFGIHPDTNQPYQWNGAGNPLTVKAADLPTLTEEQARAFITFADAAIVKAGGVPVGRLREADAARERKPNEDLLSRDPKRSREQLAAIPNEDVDYDDWAYLLYVVKGALGLDGRDAAEEWSRKSKKHDDATFEKAWGGANPDRIGAGTLDFLAREAGYKEAVTAPTHPFTHTGLADGFAARYGDDVRYVTNLGKWFQWDGCRWLRDESRNAFDLFSAIARGQVAEVDSTALLVPAKVLGLRRELLSRGYREGGESIARTMPRFTVSTAALDAHSHLLNTPAGTIDLRTGETRPHRREDLLTKCTAVAPSDRGIKGTRFEKFLIEITTDDKKLIEYLRIGLGACLFGANADGISGDHWLLFLVGVGRNGKTTLMELVLRLMGDYAKVVANDLLMATAHGERHPTEIANLLGVRLALCSEVEEGARWAENKLKLLTGDGELSARFMRQDAFEFPKTHHLVICGNHRPLIMNIDVAIRSRLHIVPFKVCFAGREDAGLPAALRAEAPQVLRWLIDGARDYYEAGKLDRCAAVGKESEDYFTSQATFDMWLGERTGKVAAVKTSAAALYRDFRDWKTERGEGVPSQTRWGEEMGRRFKKERGAAVNYVGVGLLQPDGGVRIRQDVSGKWVTAKPDNH